ncbi:MAG: DUF3048 C-terminal domain-containing protein [Longilinea sp.]|nr:DUF3048 C-terminal domain-containing protein [Longilinea sp.]MCA1953996.1 DUF3048 domain-containing protein [Anaerolinea sp.]
MKLDCKICLALSLLLLGTLLASCSALTPLPPTATPTMPPTFTPLPPTATFTPQPTATATPLPSPTATPAYPPAGLGPSGFPAGVNPLTGLEVDDPALLERRPIIVKVQNLPREGRPQLGVSAADLVYEYYTEFGTTRFAAIYYGRDAEQVAPIRSGRYFDEHLIRMYKAVFVFGSADPRVYQRFAGSEFGSRLVLEGSKSLQVGAIGRYDPKGKNYLMANTAKVGEYLRLVQVDNSRQNLDGMYFKLEAPEGGRAASQLTVRYSIAIYNRWDYDAESGRYLRSVDQQNATDQASERYAPLTDAVTGEQLGVENVVVIFVPHQDVVPSAETEMMEMALNGSGDALLLRDGQVYSVRWQRNAPDAVLTLVDASGQLVPFKPGQTWFEVVNTGSAVTNDGAAWRVNFSTRW